MATFKAVAEYIHDHVMVQGLRRRDTEMALDILHLLIKKASVPLVNDAWINELLESGARGNMDNSTFTAFLRFSARRNEEDITVDVGTTPCEKYFHGRGSDPQSPEGIGPLEAPNLEHPLFVKISQNIQSCSEEEGRWQDDAVCGGLIAMRDIPQLGFYLPDENFLETLSKAMKKSEKGEESEENNPFRVRKAAYDVILAARVGWLKSPDTAGNQLFIH